MKSTVRTVAGIICAALALGCQKTEAPPPPPPQVAQPVEPVEPAEPAEPKKPQRLKWHSGMVPTSEEADFALSIGKMLFEQANFAEAEEQLKIASAGGKSEADKLLLRARAELEAKERLTAAKQALDEKDYAGAEQELAMIPGESVLRSIADRLAERVEHERERKSQEFEEKVLAAVKADFEPEAAQEEKEEKGDGGIEVIAGEPTDQGSDSEDGDEDGQEPPAPPAPEEPTE